MTNAELAAWWREGCERDKALMDLLWAAIDALTLDGKR